MSNKPENPQQRTITMKALLNKAKSALTRNWGIKLVCFGLAILLWGGQISQDPNLTREKTFTDVSINRVGEDALMRNGLIVVSGLSDLSPIQMRAEVPQKQYASATPGSYNLRVDLSRITAPGEQMLPLVTTSSNTYGQVTWLSQSEVKVVVDSYETRRRIPVELDSLASAPAGFYAPPPSRDPATVTISGPGELVRKVVKCQATYDMRMLEARAGTQSFALSFTLKDAKGDALDQSLISVTSESVTLDSVLVEQQLHPLRTVDINLAGVTKGEPSPGYQVVSISADPSYLSVAGSNELLKSLKTLDLSGRIDIEGVKESLIRAVRVERPQGALYVSEDAVYVNVQIAPVAEPMGRGNP